MYLFESPAHTNFSRQLTLSLKITTLCTLGLLICFFADFFQAPRSHFVTLLVKVVPLALFLFEFKKVNPKTFSWFCFLLLVYFIFLMPLLKGGNGWLDWIQLVLVTVCFISTMMNVRWLKQAARNSTTPEHQP